MLFNKVMYKKCHSIKLFFKALAFNYFAFIRLAKTAGSHRYMPFGQMIVSAFLYHSTIIILWFKPFFRKRIIEIRNNQLIKFGRHPNLIAPPFMPRFGELNVCITYYCNKRCSFCYTEGLKKEFKEHMSVKDFEFLCHWAWQQNWRNLRLLGGEPTAHPKFNAILDLSKQQEFIVSFSTNGLFNPELNSYLDKSFIQSISFSYPQDEIGLDKMRIFQGNIKQVISKKIPVVLSGVIYPDRDDWRKVLDLAKEFPLNIKVRFAMIIPRGGEEHNFNEFGKRAPGLSKQIINASRYAHKNHVVFYFCRPLLLCMFNLEEIEFLRSISPFLFYSRCPLCLNGNYDVDFRLVVNPDLSCFPCTALFFKGIKINSQTTREMINQHFKPIIRQLTHQLLMDSCQACKYFINYKLHLEDAHQDIADREVCQGGCLRYRIKQNTCVNLSE